jgi:hypothetical protein
MRNADVGVKKDSPGEGEYAWLLGSVKGDSSRSCHHVGYQLRATLGPPILIVLIPGCDTRQALATSILFHACTGLSKGFERIGSAAPRRAWEEA